MLLAYVAILVLACYLGYTGITCFIAAKPIAGVICSILFLFFAVTIKDCSIRLGSLPLVELPCAELRKNGYPF